MIWRVWQSGVLLFFTTGGLFGCASAPPDTLHASTSQVVADQWPNWAGGEPRDTPPRLPAAAPFPNVLEAPPSRSLPILSAEQQAKAASDLDAARSRVAEQVRAAKVFDERNTAAALSEIAKGRVAGEVNATFH